MTTPHTSWAGVYDVVYEQSFGEFYNIFTHAIIEQVKRSVTPPARIVDFGAGTGRLSIPLSACGYEVQAVEPCEEMLNQLTRKPGGASISVFNGKMQDFQTDSPFDMAICVFTVLLYILDEESLRKSIQAVSDSLRPGGLLLIDIPSKGIFQSYSKNTPIMKRSVSVSPSHDDIFDYDENTTIIRDGQAESYVDHFQIRHWDFESVLDALSQYGFSIKKDLSNEVTGTGSHYLLMEKQNNP